MSRESSASMISYKLFTSVLSFIFLFIFPVTPLPTNAKRQTTNPILQDTENFLSSIALAASSLTTTLTLPTAYSLPQNDPDKISRAAGVALKQTTFLYGPPVAGGPFFPTGALGEERVLKDQVDIQLELNPELAGTVLDDTKATADVAKVSII